MWMGFISSQELPQVVFKQIQQKYSSKLLCDNKSLKCRMRAVLQLRMAKQQFLLSWFRE